MSTLNFLYCLPRLLACTLLQSLGKDASFVKNSLHGKVAVVTGGNGGIGFETSKGLALRGCHVFILCRNLVDAEAKATEINDECKKENSSGDCQVLRLDTSDLESVKTCVVELRKVLPVKEGNSTPIDYFICNAGMMLKPYSKSPQGYELHYATNHLGHFALVGGLLDLLRQSHARVIILTGDIAVLAHDASPDYVYNDDGLLAYCRSKICNQAFARLLHERYGTDISAYTVHPGVINSNLVPPGAGNGIAAVVERNMRPFFMIDSKRGAQATFLCCLADETEIPKGSYYHNVFGITNYHVTAAKQDWAEQMWIQSVELVTQHGVQLKF